MKYIVSITVEVEADYPHAAAEQGVSLALSRDVQLEVTVQEDLPVEELRKGTAAKQWPYTVDARPRSRSVQPA